jgi:protein associated with RNAse G/E
VVKRDWQGREVLRWPGRTLHLDPEEVVVEARFARSTFSLPYLTLAQGDRMLEHYYTQRWYNVFEIYAGESPHLKGWYCNLSRPARLNGDLIEWDDLALDLFVSLDGKTILLDEEEFEALALSQAEGESVREALGDLQSRVGQRSAPFEALARTSPAAKGAVSPRA